jgi:hypothetical protein
MQYPSWGTITYPNDRWIRLMCDDELARYYRAQIHDPKLMLPMWGTHITVVNGRWEKIKYKKPWQKHQGESVEFTYSNEIKYDPPFYFLYCYCERLGDIREELGLHRVFARRPLHITLGRNAPSGRKKLEKKP